MCRDGYVDMNGNHCDERFFYYRYFGYCLDCLDSKKESQKQYQITHFCDGCEYAFICRKCETVHRVCKKCREQTSLFILHKNADWKVYIMK